MPALPARSAARRRAQRQCGQPWASAVMRRSVAYGGWGWVGEWTDGWVYVRARVHPSTPAGFARARTRSPMPWLAGCSGPYGHGTHSTRTQPTRQPPTSRRWHRRVHLRWLHDAGRSRGFHSSIEFVCCGRRRQQWAGKKMHVVRCQAKGLR